MKHPQNCASPLVLWLPSSVTGCPGGPLVLTTVRLPPAMTAWFGAAMVTVCVLGELEMPCESTTTSVTWCEPSASVSGRIGLLPELVGWPSIVQFQETIAAPPGCGALALPFSVIGSPGAWFESKNTSRHAAAGQSCLGPAAVQEAVACAHAAAGSASNTIS